MTKKDLKITIDEKVLEKGKNAIPNLDWVHITDIKVDTNSGQDVLEKYEKYGEYEF